MTRRYFVLLGLLLLALPIRATAEVLIVADEFPAMEVLANRLKTEENVSSTITNQTGMPKVLQSYRAVVVYIHRELSPAAERAFIEYAEGGGRLVLLHHSISSGKRKNKDWFSFLGVELPEGSLEQGGYKWIEGITVQWTNLATNHFVMTNDVSYAVEPKGERDSETAGRPAFTLRETEVYLNHVLKGPRTILMGLRYKDEKTGKTWIQETAGWCKRAGRGMVIYFMPGHMVEDFKDATYGRIVVNAITAPQSMLH